MNNKSRKALRQMELKESWIILNKILLGKITPKFVLKESAIKKYNENKAMMLYNYATLCNKLGIYGTNLEESTNSNDFYSGVKTIADKILTESANQLADENVVNILKDDINTVMESTNFDRKLVSNLILREHLLKNSIDNYLIKPLISTLKVNNKLSLTKDPEISKLLETHASLRNTIVNGIVYPTR